ncbi:XRE family transcriptional regulator [Roseixanthobacter glucoisosaccharinicivorans]|uniref:XRE family transcriptional regulator n=1 Tax=Roseixanthobacter glucoisosaccharinicivorans TaxID=3119923 RepID=UPI003729C80C
MERNDRLRQARERRGFKTAADAARALAIPYGTYSGHENGLRGIKNDDLMHYAKAFRVPLAWLAYGEGSPDSHTVPVVGYVGAGAEVHGIDDHEKGGGLDEIEAPPGASPHAVAVRVRGESMLPAYREGDHIIYDELATGADIARYINKECVVRLTDGRTFIKTLARGSEDDCWTLWSYNAPPMTDMLLEWAAKVRWVEKA